jgi:arginine N-succinyltransferase
MDYRDADAKARRDKKFVTNLFPRGPVSFNVLSPEAQKLIGVAGSETQPVVNILTALGFRYLHQIDPFDGGPHYGAAMSEIRFDVVEEFFLNQEEEREIRWMFTPL